MDFATVRPELLRYAKKLTQNDADAEDLVQWTCERGWKFRERFDGKNLSAWLIHLMRNVHNDTHRMATAGNRNGEHVTLIEDLDAPANDQSDCLALANSLTRAIGMLRPWEQQIVALQIQGFSDEEKATELDIPIRTARTRLWKARQDLATIWAGE